MSHSPAPSPTENDPAEAFIFSSPEQVQVPVLFASPHSGTHYPGSMTDQMCVPLMTLRRTEDAFVNELFSSVTDRGAALISATYARGYVDLNRSPRELDPDMFADGLPRVAAVRSPRVRAGLGCIPRTAPDGQEIYEGPISRAEGIERLERVHDTYHTSVSDYLEHLQARFGVAVLIDCHSMPSGIVGRQSLPDIVLGDRFGSSCTNRLTRHIERSFRSLGYSVKRNAPYAGGYTTRRYGRPKIGQHAIQIEIRRDLYMDENNVIKSDGYDILKSDIEQLLPQWLRLIRSMARPERYRDAAE